MSDNGSNKNNNENPDLFGSNSWFVDYLYSEYKENPESVPEQWKQFFNGEAVQPGKKEIFFESTEKSSKPVEKIIEVSSKPIKYPQPLQSDEPKVIAGSSARILENMESSLTIPTATSFRNIPVKLLEENRSLINSYHAKIKGQKISFTHFIGYAIVQAAKIIQSMNNSYSEVNGKPFIVKRGEINLGLAIDLERKDGSRSLLVPNIKNAGSLNFAEFVNKYEDLVKRSRTGAIDPVEFQGTTITLTNPGTIGTIASVPRLMIGQGTIIATGAIQYPAEYQAMSPETISNLGISKIMGITSTYDHRIIQGAESGQFLSKIHELLTGAASFYDEIFEDLGVPLKPYKWETDIQAKGSEGTIQNMDEIAKQGRARQMINMFRVRGHLMATIDPLDAEKTYHAELDPAFYGLTIWDLDRYFVTHDFGGFRTATLRQILDKLQKTYCDHIGVEYMHIQSTDEKVWLQNRMEPFENRPNYDSFQKKAILQKLIEAEGFEHFIHTKFVGHKRFSLEGLETTIPALDYLLTIAADNGVQEIVLGMAHRGRLNILTNIIGKSYDSIFSEFEDLIDPNSFAGSGDVKYHLGAYGKIKTRHRKEIGISISCNPSHLEWVNPVVEGITRAKQTRLADVERSKILPLLLHGDSAFAGQGIVAETLNLSQLAGYRTGGTIHVITNNQIGFTTTPEEARSSVYASDVAKMVQAPIFHVNGDEPEAALWVMKLAFDYRQKFKKDVVLDIVGYRRHGHNEADEPAFTQPILYNKIKAHPSVVKIYGDKLTSEGVVTPAEIDKMKADYDAKLNAALDAVSKRKFEFKIEIPFEFTTDKIRTQRRKLETKISEEELKDLISRGSHLPEGFAIHPKLQRFLDARIKFANEPGGKADWATGEFLAFASLAKEGTPTRLSGQDCVRGTFSQRHLAFTDINTGFEYFPINHMYTGQARVEALDSLLSEAAVMGFEYGYSLADPLSLVIWEAQFGDFANGAQIIIDNFIVCSKEKWDTPNNLVLMLPHGYEGQGPEHSSARLERFLILCAQESMEVCYPTEPAQIFHLLRRQTKKEVLRPLVIMTPKSLLRLPEAKSPVSAFTEGHFKEIIDDDSITDKKKVNRVIFTTGKIYYDLIKYRAANNITDSAIVRVEQFYPYSSDQVKSILEDYKHVNNILWVQEEPKNMGAWNFLLPRITEDFSNGQKIKYVGRPASASPAVGSGKLAMQQQQLIVKQAFTV